MRKLPEHVNKLTAKAQFALMSFVKEQYAQYKLSDVAFAEKATTELGFQVTANNVAGAREAFELPSNRDALREARKQPHTRLEKVEARLECLERLARELGWPVPKYDI